MHGKSASIYPRKKPPNLYSHISTSHEFQNQRVAHNILKNLTYPSGLHVDPGCQGSVVSDTYRENVLYTSNANDQTTRQNMTVKITTDSAKTWRVYKQIYSGPSGYSQLVQLNKTHMGLLFECGLESDPKTFKQTISFVTFEIANL